MTIQPDNTGSKRSSRESAGSDAGNKAGTLAAESRRNPAKDGKVQPQEVPAASRFIRENFDPNDRLAVVACNRKSGAAIQRLARAEKIAAPDCQHWLCHMNENRYEIYLSMNTLKEEARGRTKGDIAAIRHLYLDLDHGGREALDRLRARRDLPQPNYIVTTSPDRFQVVWKVDGFTKEQVERLQRNLAQELGADLAATDSTRVLRLPGFKNNKYQAPHLVVAERLSDQIHRPDQFPTLSAGERNPSGGDSERAPEPSRVRQTGTITQSERDWAYARRALWRGDSRESIVAAIASYRRYDKHNPRQYAERTVDKAAQSHEARQSRTEATTPGPER